ncbi:hypothetical protein TREMEDRAFT_13984, partial [Tremella mesenterica DSM 1558]|uniref:uncharacterized protein n=1 Tax=Tremella mesenterica (strain ATCC 24925 / CBS 8224 / DSM 1558 / NBRC 9311 / NRRL Y-6157 / RJB 2259-6 / UBC 559-6) TaxID=578456 RepID=UPI0003F4A03D
LPTTFLPPLPRSLTSLHPLLPSDLIPHIVLLRQLYLPPVHGGIPTSSIATYGLPNELRMTRERRFSPAMSGLGLDIPSGPGHSGRGSDSEEVGCDHLNDSPDTQDPEDEEGLYDDSEEEEEEDPFTGHLDNFERDWAERWLSGVVRRSQTWLEDHESETSMDTREYEMVLRESVAVLAMMAGTSAAGSLTRHLLFPVHPSLSKTIPSIRSNLQNSSYSPETNTFLSSLSLSYSPTKSISNFPRDPPSRIQPSTSPSSLRNRRISFQSGSSRSLSLSPNSRPLRRRKRTAIPILLHDAPMTDHLSVGVQTWGSAILLGREIALDPERFELFRDSSEGIRVLELGAGTGLLSILCRKLLDLRSDEDRREGLVVATDFLPEVLENLRVCVDLNFPPPLSPSSPKVVKSTTDISADTGIHIAKLDWTTFPRYMASLKSPALANLNDGGEEMSRYMGKPFDLVLASDCVYDTTHARLLREVVGWVLRLPEGGDEGGTFHLLSPLRPTFGPELQSIDDTFPLLSSYPPLSLRQPSTNDQRDGEGLGSTQGLRLGVRGDGKKSKKGRKGEGRVDEGDGYWWWEIGWG